MPGQIIDQLHASLKHINMRFENLGRATNELEFITYSYHLLSYEINQIDVPTFTVRQAFEQLREACRLVGGWK